MILLYQTTTVQTTHCWPYSQLHQLPLARGYSFKFLSHVANLIITSTPFPAKLFVIGINNLPTYIINANSTVNSLKTY